MKIGHWECWTLLSLTMFKGNIMEPQLFKSVHSWILIPSSTLTQSESSLRYCGANMHMQLFKSGHSWILIRRPYFNLEASSKVAMMIGTLFPPKPFMGLNNKSVSFWTLIQSKVHWAMVVQICIFKSPIHPFHWNWNLCK